MRVPSRNHCSGGIATGSNETARYSTVDTVFPRTCGLLAYVKYATHPAIAGKPPSERHSNAPKITAHGAEDF